MELFNTHGGKSADAPKQSSNNLRPIMKNLAAKLAIPQLPKSAMFWTGIGILLFFIVVAVLGPLFIHGDPNAFSNESLAAPSLQHLLGTTLTGQDVFSQLVIGTKLTLLSGFVAGIIATTLSVIMGLVSGYLGGWADDILSLITNIFLVIPGAPLAIVLSSYVPNTSVWPIVIIVGLTNWAWGARVLRSQTLTMRDRDFIQASKLGGENNFRIIFFDIMPNLIAIVASSFIFTTIYAILTEIGLAFLGLGNILAVSWGNMLYWAQNSGTLLSAWWWFLPPGLCVALLGSSLAFINFGLDTIVNPKLSIVKPKKRGKKAAE